MATIALKATKRDASGKAKDIRRNELVPGVLYGHKTENQPIQCEYQAFHKTYVDAGESTIVELDVEGKKTSVLIQSLHLDPVTGSYEHVDFFAPDMMKEVTTNVPIKTINEAPGVKEQGGVLVRNRDQVSVKCLPKDLPHEIVIDLTPLENFHDAVNVKDLTIPGEVTIMEDPNTLIVSIAPPRKEEEVKPVIAEGEEGEAAPAEGEEGTKEGEGEEKKEEEKKES